MLGVTGDVADSLLGQAEQMRIEKPCNPLEGSVVIKAKNSQLRRAI